MQRYFKSQVSTFETSCEPSQAALRAVVYRIFPTVQTLEGWVFCEMSADEHAFAVSEELAVHSQAVTTPSLHATTSCQTLSA